MMAEGRPVFSISAVAKMVGVPVGTIRTWEERYALVVPERSAAGHRLYSRDQVEQLQFVQSLMAEGASAGDAHRLLAERQDGGRPVAASSGDTHKRLAILMAEHDPYAAELEEFFLRTEGYQVDVALTADAAMESFSQRPPSLAVVELLISGGVGLSLCRSFKQDEAVPVIAVSVLEAREMAMEAGADAFLSKPLDPLQLVSTVSDLLGSSAFLRPGMESAK